MPDEAILALVRGQLGIEQEEAQPIVSPAQPRTRKTRTKRGTKATAAARTTAVKPATKTKVGRPKKKRTSAARQKVLSAVERAVKAAKGLSASQVATATGVGQVRVATALRELKLAKRIHQGGDRRFARYARDKKTAEAASLHARSSAKGPIITKRGRKGKKR